MVGAFHEMVRWHMIEQRNSLGRFFDDALSAVESAIQHRDRRSLISALSEAINLAMLFPEREVDTRVRSILYLLLAVALSETARKLEVKTWFNSAQEYMTPELEPIIEAERLIFDTRINDNESGNVLPFHSFWTRAESWFTAIVSNKSSQ
jgi:hypothetical protein